MVKVRGPLFSHQASGSIGNGTLQFRATKRGAQVVLPGAGKQASRKPPTANQTQTREAFQAIAREWERMSARRKAHWNDQAAKKALANGWTAYLAYRMTETLNDGHPLTDADWIPITDHQGRYLLV